MREKRAVFGGELSCHFFFADTYFGLMMAFMPFTLGASIAKSQHNLTELVSQFPQTFSTQKYALCVVRRKTGVIEKLKELLSAQDNYTLSFEDGVRLEDSQSWV